MRKPARPRFYKPPQPKAATPREVSLRIERLSDEGRGIAFAERKTLFVAGALPGETVRARVLTEKRDHADAELISVETPSPQRIAPHCPLFGECGGCQLQMLDYPAQLAHKQQVVQRLLQPFEPTWEEPLTAAPWHYRHRARLAVTARGDAPAVGFKSASSHRVVPVPACPILDRRLQPLLVLLPQWLSQLKQWRRIDELTLAVDADDRIAIDWSTKSSLPTSDRETFSSLCRAANISFGDAAPLRYGVPSQATSFTFSAGDFTQVNPAINDRMVERALTWLAPTRESRAVDLFCGLGNFTLPLGKIARSVTGIEGSAGMVERARLNAARIGAVDTHFETADLFTPPADLLQGFDLALLDPPRAGAKAVCERLAQTRTVRRVVYISCNPQTLTRDIAILAAGGFTLERAALVDMFPQTGHSEAMVCLRRSDIQGR